MAHRGSFWIWDKDAVAAVNAAGLNIAGGKNIIMQDGGIGGARNHPTAAPLSSNQSGTGLILRGQLLSVDKFLIDKDGNITLVGTVDGVDISGFKVVSIGPMAFIPVYDTDDFYIHFSMLRKNTSIEATTFNAPVNLPDGATVAKLTLIGHRDDALALMTLRLRRTNNVGTTQELAMVEADWTIGDSSGYDDTIDYATIDNVNWRYELTLVLDPNDDVMDVSLTRALIDWS